MEEEIENGEDMEEMNKDTRGSYGGIGYKGEETGGRDGRGRVAGKIEGREKR